MWWCGAVGGRTKRVLIETTRRRREVRSEGCIKTELVARCRDDEVVALRSSSPRSKGKVQIEKRVFPSLFQLSRSF